MVKSFIFILVVVAVVGFSISTYIFAQNDILSNFSISSETKTIDNKKLIDDIDTCLGQNLVGGSITINSFNNNMLTMLKQEAIDADSQQEIQEIRDKFNQLVNCDL
jgi:hypothetical protein|tara:strand:+ start:2499 stop:2816 length:318 start_codon:yes stop_codon:yes gene_type:complete